MAFWTVKTDSKSIADDNVGNYIIESGMYPVTIKHCIVRRSEPSSGKKGVWLDLIVSYNDCIQTFYHAIGITNNDGSDNFRSNLFNKLCIICGGKEGFDIEPVKKHICTNQKENTYEDVETIEEVEEQTVIVRVVKSYRKYNGEIRRNTEIRNFFREMDFASTHEIVSNAENKGHQYAKEAETASAAEYKDGITEQEAAEYEEARRNGSKPAHTGSNPTTKRRFGFAGSEDNIDEAPF